MATGQLLGEVAEVIERFVVMPDEHASAAVSLFVAHTWALDAAYATPYLAVVSPEKESGKTRLVEVLKLLVRSPWHTASTTESALFRKIEIERPTLLLDEIDAIFGSNTERTEPLRAALNAGNRRGASVARVVGQGAKMEVADFSTFCPKVLAGIDTGRLPDTIRGRSLMIHMKRRRPGEHVERLRERFAEQETAALRESLESWAEGAVDELREAVPDLPDALGDRAADAWEPLLAIADMASGDWPQRARTAAVRLSVSTDDETGRGAQLLAAVRDALGDAQAIATADLLEAINGDEELPFGGWRDGHGLDARALAKMLRPYGVKPHTVRIGETTHKGYHIDDLADVFARYLPAGSVTSVTPSHDATACDAVTDVTPISGVGPADDDEDHAFRLAEQQYGTDDDYGAAAQPAERCSCSHPMRDVDDDGLETCALCGKATA